jgi:hypothetical protein
MVVADSSSCKSNHLRRNDDNWGAVARPDHSSASHFARPALAPDESLNQRIDSQKYKLTSLSVMKFGTLRTRLARYSIVGVIMCLFVLQNAALASFPQGRVTQGNGNSQIVAAANEHCSHPAQGDGEPPAHEHHDHSHCCILCGKYIARSLDHVDVFFTSIAFPAPRRAVSIIEHFLDARDKRPTGWASSWSSRAPPLF